MSERTTDGRCLDDVQKDQAWKTFKYEADSFLRTAEFLTIDHPDHEVYKTFPVSIQNAVTEACILHCRNLCDIILSVGHHYDDLRLNQLLPSFEDYSQKIDYLRAEYGLRCIPGTAAHTFYFHAIQPCILRKTEADYGFYLAKLTTLLKAVLKEIKDYAGKDIEAALERQRERDIASGQ